MPPEGTLWSPVDDLCGFDVVEKVEVHRGGHQKEKTFRSSRHGAFFLPLVTFIYTPEIMTAGSLVFAWRNDN